MRAGIVELLRDSDVVLDALPDELAAAIEIRDDWVRRLPPGNGGLEFLVADLQRWIPGDKIRVAFLGGSSELHRQIADATRDITAVANIDLNFGPGAAAGRFRSWSETDQQYAAELRVSFDRPGNWSLVGTDNTDENIGHPSHDVGGHPWQRSVNFGAFSIKKPPNWQGVVRHEFLHALGFHHSHQNMRGPCESEFRWDDDDGYMPTKDSDGRFVPDNAGRRPGIYTYLAGFPNFWRKCKVDHNLRAAAANDVTAGPFDAESIMLYRFEPFFYKTQPSPCAPTGDGLNLSQGDVRGLQLLYPHTGPELSALARRSAAMLEVVAQGGESELGLEGGGPTAESAFAHRAATLLANRVTALG
jgi:hypothetical protein